MVYASRTGNTEELIKCLYERFLPHFSNIVLYEVDEFALSQLSEYDAIVIGTYTWGDGEIPPDMFFLYEAFEKQNVKHMITGVVGSGDRFYPHFCGAVDEFRDMLYVQTNLAVTLKIELFPQESDMERCNQFVDFFIKRVKRKSLT